MSLRKRASLKKKLLIAAAISSGVILLIILFAWLFLLSSWYAPCSSPTSSDLCGLNSLFVLGLAIIVIYAGFTLLFCIWAEYFLFVLTQKTRATASSTKRTVLLAIQEILMSILLIVAILAMAIFLYNLVALIEMFFSSLSG